MSFSVTEPSVGTKWFAGLLVIGYAIITLIPLVWIIATGFKSPADSIAYPPVVVFEPTLEGYVNLFTDRTRATEQMLEDAGPATTWYEQIARDRGTVISGPSRYGERFLNSVIIGFGSTALCMILGTMAAYAFSRFKVPLKGRFVVLHPVHPNDAAHRGRDPDLPDVPQSGPQRHPSRDDPALYGRELVACRSGC